MKISAESFRELYDFYYTPIYRFLHLYTTDSCMIEDVIQEIFLKLWRNRNDITIDNIKRYLFASARNTMLNSLRNSKFRDMSMCEIPDIPCNDAILTDGIDADNLQNLINKAIESLPPKNRELFIMSRNGGMTYRQIAVAKNISPKTVENQIGIALKKIRDTVFGDK